MTKPKLYRWAVVFTVLTALGCSEKSVSADDVNGQPGSGEGGDIFDLAEPDDLLCGEGSIVELPSGESGCVFRKPIVIETGFLCPEFYPHRFDFQTFTECDSRMRLPQIDLDFLNFWDLKALDSATTWEFAGLPEEPPATQELDILWVVDNSGSMCEEQQQLRESFDAFATGLAMEGVDFHLAVTTTQMSEEYILEPVAKPGLLQSTPQPVPGFDPTCWTKKDTQGMPIPGDYTPIREALAVAVGCMETPDMALLDVTDADIRCVLEGQPAGCSVASVGCGGAGEACEPADIFPAQDAYREIPKVLRSNDYRLESGELDLERLRADFACASLVGTRGYGIEEGLRAAVTAVSPELAGAGGANEGFVRPDSRFAVFFVTDENDCSHAPGTMDFTTACGGDICEMANHPDAVDSPLIDPAALRDQLITNLSAVKGRAFDPRETLVASFHGPSSRYTGATETSQCEQGVSLVAPQCASALGLSYGGDRYDRFLRSFPLGNTFPYAANSSEALEGWMCTGNLAPGMEAVGEFLSGAVNR